jgi:hypothetical protein
MWFLSRRKSRIGEAQDALRNANVHLEEIKSRDEEVREVSGALRDMRRRNGFGEKLEFIITEGGYR